MTDTATPDPLKLFEAQILTYWNDLSAEERRLIVLKAAKRNAHNILHGQLSQIVNEIVRAELGTQIIRDAIDRIMKTQVEMIVAHQVTALVKAELAARLGAIKFDISRMLETTVSKFGDGLRVSLGIKG